MAYLIYTDRSNLLKSIGHELIRIPRNLKDKYDLYSIKKGDSIFFFDFENRRIYGPAKAVSCDVTQEKNPKRGPFNGFGNVQRHYHYLSMQIDCSSMFKRGVPADGLALNTDKVKFLLKFDEEINILEKIRRINSASIPLVVTISVCGSSVKASVVEIHRGTSINHFSFNINDNLFRILERKKKAGEELLLSNRTDEYRSTLKELGKLVYESFLRNMGLDRCFENGGYTIDFVCDPAMAEIPLEISYNNTFLFENNIIAFRGEGERKDGSVHIKRILVIADPHGMRREAYREGILLYNLLSERDISVDLCTRELTRDLLAEYFSYYDIVHFSGRCNLSGSEVGWDIGRGFFTADDLLGIERLPHMVFSNACGNTLLFGLNFLRTGITNVICSRWKIPYGALFSFLTKLYLKILAGEEIGYAFNKALQCSYMKGNVVPLAFVFLGESRMIYEI